MDNQHKLIEELDETDIYVSNKIFDPRECLINIGDVKKQLTIVCQNIRSILKNFDDFSLFLNRLNFLPDIIILTECRLNETTPLVCLNNYKCHYSKCYLNQNDGIAVLYKNYLQLTIEKPSFQDANCLLIHIGNEYTICAIYRSPSFYNIYNFCGSLEKVLQTCKSPNPVVIGDFNIDIVPDSRDRRANDYLDTIGHYGYFPGHHLPTHDRTCLDHVLIKSRKAVRVIICSSGITDHDTVIVGIAKNNDSSSPEKNIKIKIDHPKLTAALENIDWNPIYSHTDVSEAVTAFTDILSETIQNFSTSETIRNSKSIKKPWMTTGLLNCIRKRDILHLEANKNKDNCTVQLRYKNYRNLCNNIIQNLKDAHDKKAIDDANGDSKKTWMAVKT